MLTQKIGLTKSGKNIFSSCDHKAHDNFSRPDHLDAQNLHLKIVDVLGPEYFGPENEDHHIWQAEFHSDLYYGGKIDYMLKPTLKNK